MTVRYREATHVDAAAVARLHAESWRSAYRGAYPDSYLDGPVWQERLDVWTKRLTGPPPNQFVVVAEDEAELVGFAAVLGANDERYGSYLDNLHAHPERKRQGIGRGLIRECAKWCMDNYPDEGFYLGVLVQNVDAQRFYAALGAVEIERYVGAPPGGGPSVDVCRYAWPSLADIRV